jgi:multiple antibiotic resistance protein
MDPLGNVPLYLSVLKAVAPERRRTVLLREIAIAYFVLLAFLFAGRYVLTFLQLDQSSIGISGGIVLFLIAIRMIFPREDSPKASLEGEPLVVPLAIPLFAGPSVLAALLLIQSAAPAATGPLFLALTIAWLLSGLILLASTFFYRVLGERGLIAMERLMGMLLVMVAVQMFMNGVKTFMNR